MTVHRGLSPPGAVVGVGASAGGVDALKRLVADLPADLGAAVLVVLHVPSLESKLPQILDRRGPLPADHAQDGEPLRENRICVAPPDRHLLVEDDRIRVVRGPAENRHRPAVDPLFRSLAHAYGPSAVAVVLTGSLDDGAAGSAAVSRNGGTVVVQDPDEALFPSMPLSAIAADNPDFVVRAERMGEVVSERVKKVRLARRQQEDVTELREVEFAEFELGTTGKEAPRARSPFGCPTCGGGLWEAEDDVLRFRCRVGHAFGAETLLYARSEGFDTALWVALRALNERAQLAKRLGSRMREQGSLGRADDYDAMVEEAERSSRVIRGLLLGRHADEH